MRDTQRTRARRVAWTTTVSFAAVVLLTGCGDLQPDDLDDLFNQARDAIDQVEDTLDEVQEQTESSNPEFEESMREAREDWDTYLEPPPDVPTLDTGLETLVTERDGRESATEAYDYGDEELDAVTDYYSEKYGSEPEVDPDARLPTKKWRSETSETVVTENFNDTFSTETTWYKP